MNLNFQIIFKKRMTTNVETLLINDNICHLNECLKQTFIAKTYTTVFSQLLFIGLFVVVGKLNQAVSQFMICPIGMGVLFVFFNIWIVLSVFLFCLGDSLREHPYNIVFVISYTILLTYFLVFISIQNTCEVLLLSGALTLFLVSGITIYAWQTKIAYTEKGNYLLISLLSLISFGLMNMFLQLSILTILYPLVGTTLFAFYIIYSTKLLFREFKYSPDDYLIASINIYLGIITLFVHGFDLLSCR